LEFDVRRCGDGRLVVIHDDRVDRTTNGTGYVRDLAFDELRRLDAGFGEPIPLLAEILDQFGSRCLLNIELKDAGITHDVRSLVLERRLERHVIVSSFDWQELRQLTPEIPIGLLSSKLENLLESAKELGAAAIHPRHDLITRTLVEAAHEAALRIHAWTVNDLTRMRRLRDLSVDGVFTDFPERCSKSVLPDS
jgi:glycerophosphoryl diester phosphodiesterase